MAESNSSTSNVHSQMSFPSRYALTEVIEPKEENP